MTPSLSTRIYAALACLRGDLQCSRQVLPWKRAAETAKFEFGGFKYHATVSRYDDGRMAELFLVSAKTGDALRAINRDGAIAVSIALQYGATVEQLRDAMGRTGRDQPESPVAAALDLMTGREVMP